MLGGVLRLLKEAGIEVSPNGKSLRPKTSDLGLAVKILKPQNIGKLIEFGRYDIGITGYDWLVETGAKTVELLDLNLYNGKVVAAVPKNSGKTVGVFFNEALTVASEFENISKDYLDSEGFNYQFIRSYGATEGFPPEDADMVIDNTFTGKTLEENNLKIVNVLLNTSARLIANRQCLEDNEKKQKIMQIVFRLNETLKQGVKFDD